MVILPEYIFIFAIFAVLILVIILLYGRYRHWRAIAETLETKDEDSDGWRTEALYLRHSRNAKAAEFAEYN